MSVKYKIIRIDEMNVAAKFEGNALSRHDRKTKRKSSEVEDARRDSGEQYRVVELKSRKGWK